MDGDTEVLLALLSSLLVPPVPDTQSLLNALVDSNGDVEAAARLLRPGPSSDPSNSRHDNNETRKRKATSTGLDGWLVSKTSDKKEASSSKPRSKRQKQIGSRENARVSTRIQDDTNTDSHCSTTPKPQSSGNALREKEPVDLMTVLRPPPSQKTSSAPRHPPLMLSNPDMVSQHTPCTLHPSVLPPELACDLFYTMMDAAQGWSRNKWWLFDRLVESPHRTSFYARINDGVDGDETWQEAAQLWYNGRKTEPPQPFPEEMEEACRYIEKVVNEEICKRQRYPLEWGGSGTEGQCWRANVAAANCYEGAKETVGFHSDQLTYLGPYPTIASLSLGTSRIFRLREVIPSSEAGKRSARTYNIPVMHNSLTIMHASTQERFKHCVPPQNTLDVFRPSYPRRMRVGSNDRATNIEPSNCRINITFRFFRPDYRPHTIPRCKCGVPAVLKPDMKGRVDGPTAAHDDKHSEGTSDIGGARDEYSIRYWWMCYAGAQSEGKTCGMWKVMDAAAEGRGPFVAALGPKLPATCTSSSS